MLLLLAESGQIKITISEQVVAETERAIARKVPAALNDVRRAILASQAAILRDPGFEEVQAHLNLISHPADVPILLAAMQSGADYLVTLNRRHFMDDPQVSEKAQIPGGAPDQAAKATSKIWTKVFPTSRRAHSSKTDMRKRPYC